MDPHLLKLWRTAKQMLAKANMHLHKHWPALIIFILGIAASFVFLYWIFQKRWPDWTGFGSYLDSEGKLQRGKTFWDWLELLIIPLVLALGAFWLQRSERDNDRKLAEERRHDDQNRVNDQQQETVLQDYLGSMTELLLDEKHPLRESGLEDEVRVVARTRTLAALRRLDPIRKGMLVKFLYEAGLIIPGAPKNDGSEVKENQSVIQAIIGLSGADLSEADLSGSILRGANLSQAILNKANLNGAFLNQAIMCEVDLRNAKLNKVDLRGAILSRANLNGVDMREAYLSEADLSGAFLNEANLGQTVFRGADMHGAELSGANLSRADLGDANLNRANMSRAKLNEANMRKAKLAEANLSSIDFTNTVMPDGKKYNSSIQPNNRNSFID